MSQLRAMKPEKAFFYKIICFCSFFIPLVISEVTLASSTYSGVISKENKNIYLVSTTNKFAPLELKTLTAEAQKTLLRLVSGDFLEGSGDVVNNALVLDTIDFVALAALIGTWRNGLDWIDFKDFSTALVSLSAQVKDSNKALSMKYSIVPGGNNSWKILFSAEDNVIAASLTINGNVAQFNFYDQESDISRIYELTKLNFSNAVECKNRR